MLLIPTKWYELRENLWSKLAQGLAYRKHLIQMGTTIKTNINTTKFINLPSVLGDLLQSSSFALEPLFLA